MTYADGENAFAHLDGSEHRTASRPPEDEGVAAQSMTWVTTAATEFLNSLCPVAEPEFPTLLDWAGLQEVREQFDFGFNRLADEISNLEYHAQFALSDRERAVWLTVKRKTLNFRKLGDKIPRRKFTHGEEGNSGRHGIPALPPCGVNNRHLDDAINDLVAVGWLSRFVSDTYYGNASYIYLPFPGKWLLKRFFQNVYDAASRGTRGRHKEEVERGQEIAMAYYDEALSRCAEFLTDPPEYAALAPVTTRDDAVTRRKLRRACRKSAMEVSGGR